MVLVPSAGPWLWHLHALRLHENLWIFNRNGRLIRVLPDDSVHRDGSAKGRIQRSDDPYP